MLCRRGQGWALRWQQRGKQDETARKYTADRTRHGLTSKKCPGARLATLYKIGAGMLSASIRSGFSWRGRAVGRVVDFASFAVRSWCWKCKFPRGMTKKKQEPGQRLASICGFPSSRQKQVRRQGGAPEFVVRRTKCNGEGASGAGLLCGSGLQILGRGAGGRGRGRFSGR